MLLCVLGGFQVIAMWFLECSGWLPRCNYVVVVRVFLIVARMLLYSC